MWFVRSSVHRALRSAYAKLELNYLDIHMKHTVMLTQWNALVERINAKGGETFLAKAEIAKPQFTKDEIKDLLMLCHPDKHGNSKLAEEMTKTLLAMRK